MNLPFLRNYAVKMRVANATPKPATTADAEAEVTRIIMSVTHNLSLCPNLKFGYHTRQDVQQQGILIALAVLEEGKYDVWRPLENFLHVHIKRRLLNWKRDSFLRSEAPCKCCDAFNPPPEPCQKWKDWFARNTSKQNLMRPLDVSIVCDEGERNMSLRPSIGDEVAFGELERKIETGLPVELRADYLRMRGGVPVPKARRELVRDAVLSIVGDELAEGQEATT